MYPIPVALGTFADSTRGARHVSRFIPLADDHVPLYLPDILFWEGGSLSAHVGTQTQIMFTSMLFRIRLDGYLLSCKPEPLN